ncbi:MAG: four helix bundle protein [Acidobacteria bacterium]|nr:four helix bundle protein [Acidobacteriota bacterium]
MAKFNSFEEINAWKRAFEVTMDVYRISSNGSFSKDFGLKDQIRRASVSIMANIAEGHGRRTNSEFANFLSVARGSAAEVQSHLHIARGLGYIDDTEFRTNYEDLSEVSKMCLALARYLRENDNVKTRKL